MLFRSGEGKIAGKDGGQGPGAAECAFNEAGESGARSRRALARVSGVWCEDVADTHTVPLSITLLSAALCSRPILGAVWER